MSEPTPKLNAAIAAVMAKVKRLEKGDRNNFGKYAYTSVDDFKDAVRPLLAEAGITIHATEVGTVETIELTKTDDSGRQTKSVVAKYVFSFTLEHNSGEKAAPSSPPSCSPTPEPRRQARHDLTPSRNGSSPGFSCRPAIWTMQILTHNTTIRARRQRLPRMAPMT